MHPVLEEKVLELRDHRPFDENVGVPPFRRVARLTFPAVVDREPPGESDRAVDRDDAPMGAVPDAPERIDTQRLVDGDTDAGGSHIDFEIPELAPETIHEETNLDTGARALRQRLREQTTDLSFAEYVLLDIDALLGVANRAENCLKRIVAILEKNGAVV